MRYWSTIAPTNLARTGSNPSKTARRHLASPASYTGHSHIPRRHQSFSGIPVNAECVEAESGIAVADLPIHVTAIRVCVSGIRSYQRSVNAPCDELPRVG